MHYERPEIGCPWAIKMDKPFFIGQRQPACARRSSRDARLSWGFTLPSARPFACSRPFKAASVRKECISFWTADRSGPG